MKSLLEELLYGQSHLIVKLSVRPLYKDRAAIHPGLSNVRNNSKQIEIFRENKLMFSSKSFAVLRQLANYQAQRTLFIILRVSKIL